MEKKRRWSSMHFSTSSQRIIEATAANCGSLSCDNHPSQTLCVSLMEKELGVEVTHLYGSS
ncbi:MAG: hypothetical protein LC751_09880, partial [Actinobacteria bacterium]|nr:hypothetical protein [Actinomycetota bacterium]